MSERKSFKHSSVQHTLILTGDDIGVDCRVLLLHELAEGGQPLRRVNGLCARCAHSERPSCKDGWQWLSASDSRRRSSRESSTDWEAFWEHELGSKERSPAQPVRVEKPQPPPATSEAALFYQLPPHSTWSKKKPPRTLSISLRT